MGVLIERAKGDCRPKLTPSDSIYNAVVLPIALCEKINSYARFTAFISVTHCMYM